MSAKNLAEVLIRHVMEYNIVEPEINLHSDCVVLVWSCEGHSVKVHLDELDHKDYIVTKDKQYREIDKTRLLKELRSLYKIPQ